MLQPAPCIWVTKETAPTKHGTFCMGHIETHLHSARSLQLREWWESLMLAGLLMSGSKEEGKECA